MVRAALGGGLDFSDETVNREARTIIANAALVYNKSLFAKELIRSSVYTNMLLNLGGRMMDFVSNQAKLYWEIYPVKFGQATADMLATWGNRSALLKGKHTQEQREVFFKELAVLPTRGMGKGLKAAAKVMVGITPWREVQRKWELIYGHASDAWELVYRTPGMNRAVRAFAFAQMQTPRLMTAVDLISRVQAEEMVRKNIDTRMKIWDKQGPDVAEKALTHLAEQSIARQESAGNLNFGVDGVDKAKFIADLVAHPEKLIETAGDAFATEVTFTQSPDEATRGILALREGADAVVPGPFEPFRYFIAPFVPVLANVAKTGAEYSPTAYLAGVSLALGGAGAVIPLASLAANMYAWKTWNRGLKDIVARQMASTFASFALAWMLDREWLTGSEEMQKALGRPVYENFVEYAFTYKFGGDRYQVRIPEPFNLAFAPVINLFQAALIAKREGPDSEEARQAIANIIPGVQKYIVDNIFLQQFTGLTAERPQKVGEFARVPYAVTRGVRSFLPFSGQFRSIHNHYLAAKAEGKLAKKSYTVEGAASGPEVLAIGINAAIRSTYGNYAGDMFGQIIPGFGLKEMEKIKGRFQQEAPDQLTYFGETRETTDLIKMVPTEWIPFLRWMEVNEEDVSSIEGQFREVDHYPSMPNRNLPSLGGRLTDEQYRSYVIDFGDRIKKNLPRLFLTPGYQRATDEKKVEMIKKKEDFYRGQARARVKKQYGLKPVKK